MEFFDIFPGLECDENVRKTLGNLNVDNVTKVLAGHFLRIRTHSYIPVPDEYIEYAERLISNSLLNGQLDVRIENTEKGRDESPEETSDESIEEAPETFYGTDEDYEYVSISEISRAAEKDGYAPGGGVSSAPGKNKERKYGPRKKTAADPGMLYGKSFEGETTGISDILTEMREVVIDGEICDAGLTVTKNGVKILKVDVTDYKDTITIKMFLAEGEEHLPEVLSPGLRVRVCGKVEYDNFEGELMISRVKGIKAVKEPLRERKDESPEKRVELHLHTKFSDMDATTDISHVLKRAVEWGHRAVAITDHGVVQGFPPAFNELKEIRKRNEGIDLSC
jgi:DNA polymerase-3 subunit alpha (Gram-positive type)